jgi:hypothetical protein
MEDKRNTKVRMRARMQGIVRRTGENPFLDWLFVMPPRRGRPLRNEFARTVRATDTLHNFLQAQRQSNTESLMQFVPVLPLPNPDRNRDR